jgi:phosphotransferase system HPr (HPr) family protein
VEHESGLHLRPASMFVQKAASFQSDVKVRNVTKDTSYQNAKSAMGVMMLKVSQGDTIHIQAEGSDEVAAVEALHALIEGNFT